MAFSERHWFWPCGEAALNKHACGVLGPMPLGERHPPEKETNLALLRTLFADAGAYRHRMGLRRMAPADFYAPTPDHAEILAERRASLARDALKRTVETPEGQTAAAEFAQYLGAPALDELEPDLLIVAPPDWTLVWASVCFPSHWSLEGKTGKPLTFIHDPVPGLNAELGANIAAFFSRLNAGEGWSRANWGLSASPARDQHPDAGTPRLTETTPLESIFLRIEDQHLLKLPASGTIVFGIRIVSVSWTELIADLDLAAAIREKLHTMDPEVARYKGLTAVLPRLVTR